MIHIAYCYADFWSADDQRVYSDMGSCFCDAPETLTADVDRLKVDALFWLDSCEDDDKGDKQTGFTIYCLTEGDLDNSDYEEDDPLWMGDIDMNTTKVTEVYACSTEEGARGCNLQEVYPDANIHYLTKL